MDAPAVSANPTNGLNYIRPFGSLGLGDPPLVGGKTASLGELRDLLGSGPIGGPDGFAVTAKPYRDALTAAGSGTELHALLDDFDSSNVAELSRRAALARDIVYSMSPCGLAPRRQLAGLGRTAS
ncbi:MAG: PEP/pyruvate-binding domain-containing protein [Phenylobacterium sp.]|uniref:PEP/pyruvate-binding domain-containing protein n=1 Tax=Phenylobacterium sp. TaxID=1871053 RepID=UPI002727CBC6|nr:PEP/pyruvate-binding domain-containing protein [Phenylobacterium sp.]MDO8912617.1 PEP/pyruvate-binding domain-containing protein [Phenylobacterium sp.]MDP3101674.1 PEP/pyruvate-binding domain-containing protein [Phenylobacterium sp.]